MGIVYSPSTSNGQEFFNIGRGTGSVGALIMNAGQVSLVGTSTNTNVGRDGGVATVSVTNGSTFVATSRLATGETGLQIGSRLGGAVGANGQMTVDASTVTITGGGSPFSGTDAYGSYLTVGRGSSSAQGTLTLQNNATLNPEWLQFSHRDECG